MICGTCKREVSLVDIDVNVFVESWQRPERARLQVCGCRAFAFSEASTGTYDDEKHIGVVVIAALANVEAEQDDLCQAVRQAVMGKP